MGSEMAGRGGYFWLIFTPVDPVSSVKTSVSCAFSLIGLLNSVERCRSKQMPTRNASAVGFFLCNSSLFCNIMFTQVYSDFFPPFFYKIGGK